MDLWVVNDTNRRPGCGMFWAVPRSEAPGYGDVLASGGVPAKGGCRLRKWNRVGGSPGLGSGHLDSIE